MAAGKDYGKVANFIFRDFPKEQLAAALGTNVSAMVWLPSLWLVHIPQTQAAPVGPGGSSRRVHPLPDGRALRGRWGRIDCWRLEGDEPGHRVGRAPAKLSGVPAWHVCPQRGQVGTQSGCKRLFQATAFEFTPSQTYLRSVPMFEQCWGVSSRSCSGDCRCSRALAKVLSTAAFQERPAAEQLALVCLCVYLRSYEPRGKVCFFHGKSGLIDAFLSPFRSCQPRFIDKLLKRCQKHRELSYSSVVLGYWADTRGAQSGRKSFLAAKKASVRSLKRKSKKPKTTMKKVEAKTVRHNRDLNRLRLSGALAFLGQFFESAILGLIEEGDWGWSVSQEVAELVEFPTPCHRLLQPHLVDQLQALDLLTGPAEVFRRWSFGFVVQTFGFSCASFSFSSSLTCSWGGKERHFQPGLWQVGRPIGAGGGRPGDHSCGRGAQPEMGTLCHRAARRPRH